MFFEAYFTVVHNGVKLAQYTDPIIYDSSLEIEGPTVDYLGYNLHRIHRPSDSRPIHETLSTCNLSQLVTESKPNNTQTQYWAEYFAFYDSPNTPQGTKCIWRPGALTDVTGVDSRLLQPEGRTLSPDEIVLAQNELLHGLCARNPKTDIFLYDQSTIDRVIALFAHNT